MSNKTEIYSVAKALNIICDELKELNKKLDKMEYIENQHNEILANAFVWGWRGEDRLDKKERKARFPELTKNPNVDETTRNDNQT